MYVHVYTEKKIANYGMSTGKCRRQFWSS